MPETTFTEAIQQATEHLLETDESVIVIGLGADYSNGLDGTIGAISKKFPDRVLDTPVSEAANGGACVGMAINGLKPIFFNGRTEFALFAIDSIVTQASKWHYMFGGEAGSVPAVFRIAIGRSWGSGPQHTQSLYPLWANCTGLKAVIPSSPKMARDLLYSATLDPNPVVYLESRWLYGIKEDIETPIERIPLDKCRVVAEGSDLTIITYAEGVHEALLARKELAEKGISVEIIDLVSINPIDYETIFTSLKKTKQALVFEISSPGCSVGKEILAHLDCTRSLITCSNTPIPSATSLTDVYYPTKDTIIHFCTGVNPGYDSSFAELNLNPKTNISTLV